MSVRRLLVEAAVISLQDSRVYYPYCKNCFSRTDVEQEHTRCFKCGYRCLKEHTDYRYRLSLKVVRDKSIFGVTVFGTSLNPFFGIQASGLKRLVDNVDGAVGASTRSTSLVKAVEDCFIGRRFIFGIKVTGTESELWSGWPVANGSGSRDTVQFVASQMILPKATERSGCTVLRYYQVLLQRAEEYERGHAGTSSSFRPPGRALLLIPLHSPASAFNNTTLDTSALLSLSLLRSQHQDSSVAPTPPWQQSLGLVTSSAEQDESFSTHESRDENIRGTDYGKTPHHTSLSCVEDRGFTAEATLSPRPYYNSSLFSIHPDLSVEKSVVNTPTQGKWLSASPSLKNDSLKKCPSTQLTRTSDSLAWDDLPFSESLTEFLCEKDNASQTELHRNVQNVAETARHSLENVSHNRKLTRQMTVRPSRLLVDITNTSAPNHRHAGRGLSDEVCEQLKGRVERVCSSECGQRDGLLGPLSFEEQLEGETYNCSADLFSNSLDTDTATICTQTEAVSAVAGGSTCKGTTHPDKLILRSELAHDLHLTPLRLKFTNPDRLDPESPHFLDFIPPSQSTPNVKLTSGLRLPASRTLSSASGDATVKHTSPLWKPSSVGANPMPLCGYKRKSSVRDVTIRDHWDEVPPTPAARTQLSRKHRRRQLRDNQSRTVDSTCGGPKGDGVHCKRTVLCPRLSFLHRSMAGSGNSDNEETLGDGCLLDDESQSCDWSRDLFSDC
ncbi:DNA damage-induced apoptosis suppressor protein [Betta splendens]|uniref:DNA damage-induced apoptosis suppressor protein n=1 Tax=Betta splendens TaxID=158456 RepID=A0A6P7M493_BETSP|nr:DNA damage-induced apoptosis suppressor protein [Betta splendens]